MRAVYGAVVKVQQPGAAKFGLQGGVQGAARRRPRPSPAADARPSPGAAHRRRGDITPCDAGPQHVHDAGECHSVGSTQPPGEERLALERHLRLRVPDVPQLLLAPAAVASFGPGSPSRRQPARSRSPAAWETWEAWDDVHGLTCDGSGARWTGRPDVGRPPARSCSAPAGAGLAAVQTGGRGGGHTGMPSGGCSSTRGLYSTSWIRPSKVRCSIISRATSG